jgi:hypothetical protein
LESLTILRQSSQRLLDLAQPLALVAWAMAVLATWWHFWLSSFTRWVAAPAPGKVAGLVHRRRWVGVLIVADLVPWYRDLLIAAHRQLPGGNIVLVWADLTGHLGAELPHRKRAGPGTR